MRIADTFMEGGKDIQCNINVPFTGDLLVSTKNKKYYKVLPMLELQRLNLKPDITSLTHKHEFNSLIIRYRKPPQLIAMERRVYEMIRSLKIANNKQDLPCKPS